MKLTSEITHNSWAQRWALIAVLLSLGMYAQAQQGPDVPCDGCDSFAYPTGPETGFWYNPNQSGSGLNLDLQQGRVAGSYYGYDEDGEPEWYQFSAKLEVSELENVFWEATTKLQRFSGGNCINCEYKPPTTVSAGPELSLLFRQRNHLELRFDDGPSQFFVPLVYGSPGTAFFPEVTDYVLPDFDVGTGFLFFEYNSAVPTVSAAAISSEKNQVSPETSPVPPLFGSTASYFELLRNAEATEDGGISYDLMTFLLGYEPSGQTITCGESQGKGELGCVVWFDGVEYFMPLANFSHLGFHAISDEGRVLQAIRLFYDQPPQAGPPAAQP